MGWEEARNGYLPASETGCPRSIGIGIGTGVGNVSPVRWAVGLFLSGDRPSQGAAGEGRNGFQVGLVWSGVVEGTVCAGGIVRE